MAGAAAVLVTAGGSCSDGDSRLDTLRTDPIVGYELSVAIESETTEMAGGTSAVASPSEIRMNYTVAAADFDSAIDELGSAAADAGWALTERELVGYQGDKRIDDLDAQIQIAGNTDSNIVWMRIWSR